MFAAEAGDHQLLLIDITSASDRFASLPSEDLLSIILSRSAHGQKERGIKSHMFSLILEVLNFFCQSLFLRITDSSPVLESLSSHHTEHGPSD